MTTPAQSPSTASQPDGIIVFAHGSRDPLWRLPVESVAQRIADRAPHAAVACAYLELCEPDLPTAFAQLQDVINSKTIATNDVNIRTVRIFPLFFGVGKHAREDLPALVADLRAAHPDWRIELTPSAGEHAGVLDAAATAAMQPATSA